MTTERIKRELIKIILEIFKDKGYNVDNLDQVDIIGDFGIDSIIFIYVVVEIETHFNIEFPDEMLLPENFKCIDNIVSVVKIEIDKNSAKC